MSFEGVPFETTMLSSSARFALGPELQKERDRTERGGKFITETQIQMGRDPTSLRDSE